MVAHALTAPGAELPPELLEVGEAATAVHNGLTVDDRTLRLEQVGAGCDRGELFGPVQGRAGIDPGAWMRPDEDPDPSRKSHRRAR